jgi:hypothetical protein
MPSIQNRALLDAVQAIGVHSLSPMRLAYALVIASDVISIAGLFYFATNLAFWCIGCYVSILDIERLRLN